MTDMFLDQARFMQASDQTVGVENHAQYGLYLNLIEEEVQELRDSRTREGDLDALIDILVVTIGAIHSIGVDATGAWQAVIDSNMAKVDPVTGKIRKRKDGKVLKPDGWQPPDMTKFLK
jgi:predicted HAD superfamily Cof-like phosphohydrolase